MIMKTSEHEVFVHSYQSACNLRNASPVLLTLELSLSSAVYHLKTQQGHVREKASSEAALLQVAD